MVDNLFSQPEVAADIRYVMFSGGGIYIPREELSSTIESHAVDSRCSCCSPAVKPVKLKALSLMSEAQCWGNCWGRGSPIFCLCVLMPWHAENGRGEFHVYSILFHVFKAVFRGFYISQLVAFHLIVCLIQQGSKCQLSKLPLRKHASDRTRVSSALGKCRISCF